MRYRIFFKKTFYTVQLNFFLCVMFSIPNLLNTWYGVLRRQGKLSGATALESEMENNISYLESSEYDAESVKEKKL